MAWVKFPGNDREFNTQAIFFVGGRSGRAVICSTLQRDDNCVVGVSPEEAEKIIADAEREERRKIFEENKDEIVDAVVGRLEAAMTKKIEDMMGDLADKLIEKAHLQKPGKTTNVKRSIPKVGKP